MGLLFALGAANFAAHMRERREPRGLIQLALEDHAFAEAGRFPRENDKYRLGDFLGLVLVAGMAQGDGIDPINVTVDERGEGRFGIALDIFPQQCVVIQFLHLLINAADQEERTGFFRKT